MSRSARCLGQAVATSQFDWQQRTAASTRRPMPFMPTDVSPDASDGAPRDLPLPSIAAERLASMERDAFAKGYEQGERVGAETAAARVETLVERLVAAIDDVGAGRLETLRRSEQELVRLAIAMAERIVRREISVDPDLLTVMARVAIDRLGEDVEATIHLNPADVPRRKLDAGTKTSIAIVPDPSLPRGSCIVRSALGSIDLSIDAQVRELSRELLDEESDDDGCHDGTPARA